MIGNKLITDNMTALEQLTTQDLIDQAHSDILALKVEINSKEYLTSKELDGEDMSQYGDWKGYRKALRESIRLKEYEIKELEIKQQAEMQDLIEEAPD